MGATLRGISREQGRDGIWRGWFHAMSCWTTRWTISCSCDRRSSPMILRSIGISGEAVADGKVLASLGGVEVPLTVWLGVGSGVGSLVSHPCLEVGGYIER